ncbi:hypothetical protein PLESTB_001579500 [Pleodorina starrii]|uniref:non-specific serine/threonine protein kinase n=1 Tax=Pleodorina starrii TaxID=330485 RepID=A0A9W6F915_9CHLO|nr:hypothetical protein PLESTM_000725700 [Pleodorina starrii]GLC60151.1 hypothetical protein PLESTB_001579500 [Pleodorina starrii]
MDKYVRGKVLGKGSFGSAILVTNKLDNKNYVIKEIDVSRMPKSEREGAEQEAKLLMALNHPNIVRCLECFTHLNKLCIVMDWCSEGDLYGLLQKRRGQQLSEDTILDWLVQMCLGLKHVHDRKILHRDIKTQNVFMSTGGLLKLGDFGVSKVLNSTFQLATTAVGTPYYLSPEICQNKKYNQKSDIWSLGCVLYELATLKHAFEGPNMRALISKIIKGSYTPMPATRSRELRELCDRMLTLDWQKRPSINDILATPIMKARIQKFLSATLQAHEFSHTIIHGRPRPGQLVVGPGPAAAAAAPAGGPAGGPAGPAPSKAAPAAPPQPPAAAGAGARPSAAGPPGAARVGSAAAPARQSAASPNLMPPRGGAAAAAAAGPGAGRGLAAAAAPPGRPAVAAPVLGGAGAAALKQAQDAAAAARAKAAEAAKQREEAMMALAAKRAADAEANAKRELERAKARELAALGAQREIERLRLEEQRRKLEGDKARLEVDRKKREAARAEEERRAKAAEEARARLKDEEARRQREMEAKRKKAEEEARKKDAEKAAKEKERDDMRARIAAQRKEFQDRQAEAARNRAAAEPQMGRAAQPEVQVLAGRHPRRQWSPPRVDDGPARGIGGAAAAADEPGPAGAGAGGGGGAAAGRRSGADDYLSAEQRRAVFEERRAAAERNRRAAQEAERHGGLAEFLGVPRDTEEGDQGRQQAAAGRPSPSKAGGGGGGGAAAGQDISPDARRAAYLEMRAAAERNRAAADSAERGGTPPARQAAGAAPGGPAGRAASPLGQGGRLVAPPVPRPTDPWAAKMARLEEERRKRELEILDFQKQHWQEVREARERNKRQIMAEVRGEPPAHHGSGSPANGPGQRAPSPANGAGRAPTPPAAAPPAVGAAARGGGGSGGSGGGGSGGGSGDDDDDDMDFAAMVKDMQDVLMQDGAGAGGGGEGGAGGDDEEDDIYNDEKHNAALSGQFMLEGEVVQLPGVREGDSLALKVEALRVFLETNLGTDAFLKVYRMLESLTIEDDEAAVSAKFLDILGAPKLPYLQLVHQLIVCEENMHQEGA